MSYITRSGFSYWFRIYNWLIGFHQDIVMIFQKNYFPTCLHQNFCLLVLAGSALQPVNKDRIYFCLCLLVGVHSYIDVRVLRWVNKGRMCFVLKACFWKAAKTCTRFVIVNSHQNQNENAKHIIYLSIFGIFYLVNT